MTFPSPEVRTVVEAVTLHKHIPGGNPEDLLLCLRKPICTCRIQRHKASMSHDGKQEEYRSKN